MDWAVRCEEDDAVTRAFLERDRTWAAYLLADLEPPFRQHARFYLARQDEQDQALLLVYQPPEFSALSTMGAADGVAAALAAVPLPAATGFSIPVDHREIFHSSFQVTSWAHMQRMVLPAGGVRPPLGSEVVERLTLSDAAAIEHLLRAREHVGYFTADMLHSGVYVGVRSAGRLVAVAGTHVVAPASRVAAIGNVYTAADARQRGYGAATTAGVVRALLEEGYERIVLNVSVENTAAIRVYERLGFVPAIEYWETDHAVRRDVR